MSVIQVSADGRDVAIASFKPEVQEKELKSRSRPLALVEMNPLTSVQLWFSYCMTFHSIQKVFFFYSRLEPRYHASEGKGSEVNVPVMTLGRNMNWTLDNGRMMILRYSCSFILKSDYFDESLRWISNLLQKHEPSSYANLSLFSSNSLSDYRVVWWKLSASSIPRRAPDFIHTMRCNQKGLVNSPLKLQWTWNENEKLYHDDAPETCYWSELNCFWIGFLWLSDCLNG